MTDQDGTDGLSIDDTLVSSERARAWIYERPSRFGQLINGEWRQGASDAPVALVEPATGRTLCELRPAAATDAHAAVDAALRAAEAWRQVGPRERAAWLRSVALEIEGCADEIAALEALSAGRPVLDARERGARLAARHFTCCATWLDSPTDGRRRHEPLGVVAVICAPNASVETMAGTVARALAAGNSVVVAAGPGAALAALRLAEAAQEAGVPDGVLNVVSGDLGAGVTVALHHGVGGVVFSGAPDAAAEVRRAVAGRDLMVAVDTGSRSLIAVYDDADLDSAAAGAIVEMARFGDPSRRGGTRMLLHEAIAERFCDRLRWRMDRMRVRDPLDMTADVGPVRSADLVSGMEHLREIARTDGASVHVASADLPPVGWFVAPTLVFDAPPAARASGLDVSGPVLLATTFRSPEEAVALANRTVDGTRISLWTEDVTTALAAARDLAAGSITVNGSEPGDAAFATAPIRGGGYGEVGGRCGPFAFVRRRQAPGVAAALPDGSANPTVRAVPNDPSDPAASDDVADRAAPNDLDDSSHSADAADAAAVGAAGRAVKRALGASKWSALPGGARSRVLTGAAERCEPSAATGSAALLRAYAGWAAQPSGAHGAAEGGGLLASTREPVGVVGVVVAGDGAAGRPDSLRFTQELVIAAVTAGNRVVVACDQRGTGAVAELERVLSDAGATDGSLAIAVGAPHQLATALADHDGVDMMWLVGAPHLAEDVERRCCGAGKRMCLFDPADPDVDSHTGRALEGIQVYQDLLRLATYEKSVWIELGR